MSKHVQAKFVMVRLPVSLAARIDEAADGVPRERWVRRALEGLLVPAAARSTPGVSVDAVARSADQAERSVSMPEVPRREAKPRTVPVSRDTQRDANAEYARMMAERQARMNRGS